MHPNEQRLTEFYDAFSRLDAETMASSYAPTARFDDEAFSLRGAREVGAMWRMLCGATARGGDDWRLAYSGVSADDGSGRASWTADYHFSGTGRAVHNVVQSRFSFDQAGLIVEQRDSFPFWAWSRQALGVPGLLLGWTPLLHGSVRKKAAANLADYLAKHPAG